MKQIGLALAAACIASSVSSQMGVELWRGLKIGMSKADVETLFPSKQIDLLANCRVMIDPRFNKVGNLVSVSLHQKWLISKNDCVKPIIAALTEKYGDAAYSNNPLPEAPYHPATTQETFVWQSRTVKATLISKAKGEEWYLTYEYAYEVTGPAKIDKM